MNMFQELTHALPAIEQRLGYTFKDRSLLILAFVHRSYLNENRHVPHHNERLEFLGDSVLGMLMAEYLYRELPSNPEGDLSNLRARLVEASSCITYIQKLDLSKYILLGKGERLNGGRGRETILADFFEAIIGAIFIDGGIEAARQFLFSHFLPEISATIQKPLKNWKALLQEYVQKQFQQAPHYIVLEEVGPDHSKHFTIAVMVNEQEMGRGCGASKKEAQQAAAANAVLHFREIL